MNKAQKAILEKYVRSIFDKSNELISESNASLLLQKALIGREIDSWDSDAIEHWISSRLLPNIVYIDQPGYARMCVDALKILHNTAGTDYGTSRQRDMGQLWADMTRGYLGELAIQMLFEARWKTTITLGHEKGDIQNFLPLDVHEVKRPGEGFRPPKIKVSIKTTKAQGIWLDIPGDQFSHSDIHVLVKVCAGRDHLFSFFKDISVFKDKVLRTGIEAGSLTQEESEELYERLPSFHSIPAYICGFAKKDVEYEPLSYSGKKGTKNFLIHTWRGPYDPKDLDSIKEGESIQGSVQFEGIGAFTNQKRFLFSTGALEFSDSAWKSVVSSL